MRKFDLKWHVGYALFMFSILASPIFADDLQRNNSNSNIDNIGFMKNPPQELKEKFPMCDAFLKVEWIDKEKKIGYSRYDMYNSKGVKILQQAGALIDLDDNDEPRFDYAVTKYRQYDGDDAEYRSDGTKYQYLPRGKLQELFSFIRNGKINRASSALRIIGKEKAITFITMSDVLDVWNLSLADNRMNVCIPYPENQRMWMAELKRIGNTYDEKEVANIVKKLKKFVPQEFLPDMPGIENGEMLDLNFDGIEDYLISDIVYSYGDRYYAMEPLWKGGADKEYGSWRFPPTQKKCVLGWTTLYFTTDGKSYYLNNQCNLTELTRKGE